MKYRVAHINLKGADLIIFPIDSAMARMNPTEQTEIVKSLQRYVASAGLKGGVVAIWDKGGGKAGILADKSALPYLQGLTLSFVQSNVNRELTVRGALIGSASPTASTSESPEGTHRGGVVSVTCDEPGCEVHIDGSFFGNTPVKVRMKEGPHSLEVRKGGFRTYQKDLHITDGSDIQLQPVLEPGDQQSGATTQTSRVKAVLDQNLRGKVAEFKRRHGTGLTSLFFSDIVGSTKLKQELGDRDAVALMQKHHTMFRELLGKIPDGQEISTAGDSFFIVFGKPSEAIKFALQVQAKLRMNARQGIYPVTIRDRIGIHVGEVFIEESEDSGKVKDLFGIQVDTCARVMSLGEGDQILMTRFAYDQGRQILKGQTIEGVGPLKWLNHGPYLLKGVEDAMDICEVGEDGLAYLRPPEDSEKVQRYFPPGMRPADEPKPAQHVVVSSKSSSFQPVKRVFPSS